jgi:hypothetical protein
VVDTTDPLGRVGDYDCRVTRLGVTTPYSQLVIGNPLRVYLAFQVGSGTASFGPGCNGVSSLVLPYNISATSPILDFWWERHKTLVSLPWSGVVVGSGVNLTIVDVFKVPGR